MMNGGKVIEAQPWELPMGEKLSRKVVRLWVSDDGHRLGAQECVVYVPPYDVSRREGPGIGEMISWEDGLVFFDNDRLSIPKIGYAADAPIPEEANA